MKNFDLAPLYPFWAKVVAYVFAVLLLISFLLFGESLFVKSNYFVLALNIMLLIIVFSKENEENEIVRTARYITMKSAFMILTSFIICMGFMVEFYNFEIVKANFLIVSCVMLFFQQIAFRTYLLSQNKIDIKESTLSENIKANRIFYIIDICIILLMILFFNIS